MERNIEELWEKYSSLVGRLSDDNLNNLLEAQGQRIAECTFSQRSSEPFCGPGGLIEFSLNVTKAARDLNETLGYNIPVRSIFITALFSDLGLIGDLEDDNFIIQDSDWHREKLGQMYKWNEDCQKMSVTHRTLYIFQLYKVKLLRDEWLAIQLSGGMHYDENRFYANHVSNLAFLIQTARQAVLKTAQHKS